MLMHLNSAVASYSEATLPPFCGQLGIRVAGRWEVGTILFDQIDGIFETIQNPGHTKFFLLAVPTHGAFNLPLFCHAKYAVATANAVRCNGITWYSRCQIPELPMQQTINLFA